MAATVPTIKLPGIDVEVSTVCLGTWQFGDPTGTYTKQSEEVEDAIVAEALAAGCNFFDTAEAYAGGEAEKALGRALRNSGAPRASYAVASKVNAPNLAPDNVVAACNRSLENLGLDYIDLYQVHWPNREVPIADTMAALKGLHDAGKIKAIGVSNFGPGDLADALATGVPIVTNQLPYAAILRGIEFEITAPCAAADVKVMAYSPMAQGLLAGKYAKTADCHEGLSRSRLFASTTSSKCRHTEPGCEAELWAAVAAIRKVAEDAARPMAEVALSWVLQQPSVGTVVFGASKVDHVRAAVRAATSPIDAAAVAAVTAAGEPVKAALGTNCDLWDSTSRYR